VVSGGAMGRLSTTLCAAIGSPLHIQMARELGLHPKPCGGLANHRQEPWKLPLPACIAACYRQRFHGERPAKVVLFAEVTKRQQPSARDRARHPRARTDTSCPSGGNMLRAAGRRLRSAPLGRAAILRWLCGTTAVASRPRGNERKVSSDASLVTLRAGLVGYAAL
jgi:hypothetical protein